MVHIALDIMGGDNAPEQPILGIIQYLSTATTTVTIHAIGTQVAISNLQQTCSHHNLVCHHAPDVIGMHEHPTKALKEKPNNSISVGFALLNAGTVHAFISAGNTGAMLVSTHFTIKTIPGVLRPAIAVVIPKLNGGSGLLTDVGLNADCKPEHLYQFAQLSNLFAQVMFEVQKPNIALLNIGEEEGKGNLLAQETYTNLKQDATLNFIGNIEGRDIFDPKADVIVTDGFTGNVVLKMAEQLYEIAQQQGINNAFFNRCNYASIGGSPILGISKPVIIGHGISNHTAFANMLTLAQRMATTKVMEVIAQRFVAK